MTGQFPIYKKLILLIGSNVLPNVIATHLLSAGSQTKAYLLYTPETAGHAEALRTWLRGHSLLDASRDSLRLLKDTLPSTISGLIRNIVQEQAPDGNWPAGTIDVGLNYTGGKKVMAVHAVRAARHWSKVAGQSCQCSYINADDHSLLIDPDGFDPLYTGQILPFRDRAPRIGLKDMLALHGLELGRASTDLLSLPVVEAIAKLHQEYTGNLKMEFKGEEKDSPGWIRRFRLEKTLPETTEFQPVAAAIREYMNSVSGENDWERLENALGFAGSKRPAEKLERFLKDTWMEVHVLKALQDLAKDSPQLNITETFRNVQPTDAAIFWELDVVAIRQHQLYVLSCTTHGWRRPADRGREIAESQAPEGNALLKSKLFEAYVRAIQLGGDEARVGLVCLTDRPDRVKREIEGAFLLSEKIEVFGINEVADLKPALAEWFLNT